MNTIKRMLCLLICVSIALSFVPLCISAEPDYQYGILTIAKSDNVSHKTTMNVMVCNNVLYVDLSDIADYMGYQYKIDEETGCLVNKEILRLILFYAGSKKVTYNFFYKVFENEYEAPAQSIAENGHFWVPFHYKNGLFMDVDEDKLKELSKQSMITLKVDGNLGDAFESGEPV